MATGIATEALTAQVMRVGRLLAMVAVTAQAAVSGAMETE